MKKTTSPIGFSFARHKNAITLHTLIYHYCAYRYHHAAAGFD
jgi:hypothetical protein